MSSQFVDSVRFSDLGLNEQVLGALEAAGYQHPTPIQAGTIPQLLEGKDLLGQAQTGTGKTAAFALPLLTQIDLQSNLPQALILAPTRELALQIADAMKQYGSNLKGLKMASLVGGQDYKVQLNALNRGAQVIIGTPGRVMDHMRRSTLKIKQLKTVVLDEADEMLRMGFVEDIEWILGHAPKESQMVLFSATMPREIKRIAKTYLKDPVEVKIASKTTTAATVEQNYWFVRGANKFIALTRFLEVEQMDGAIVFAKTKIATVEIASDLQARGYKVAALNGDLAQTQRVRTVDDFKSGKLDIIVATDVAARGLDIDRVSHVFNYNIPSDPEAYTHRIGRTGRAGRSGKAILFVSAREKRELLNIEKTTKQKITEVSLPSIDQINAMRIDKFKQRVVGASKSKDLPQFSKIIEELCAENELDETTVAAALAVMAQGKVPLLETDAPKFKQNAKKREESRPERREGRTEKRREKPAERKGEKPAPKRASRTASPSKGMQRYRIELGVDHDVRPKNIVGAIANEAGLEGQYIENLTMFDTYSHIDLPEGMPNAIFKDLKKTWICGKQLKISRMPSQ